MGRLRIFFISIPIQWCPLPTWQVNHCVELVGELIQCNVLHRGFSIHHGPKWPNMRQLMLTNTNRYWRTGQFLFLSVSGIWILLFHQLRAFKRTSYHLIETHTKLGHVFSFPEILPIHCGRFAVHKLDIKIA